MNKKTNTLSIVGFVLSFFLCIISSIVCFISLEQIHESKEKGKSLAIAGIIISFIKIVILISAFILLATHNFNYEDNTTEMCKKAQNCTFDVDTNSYSCSFINSEGVEEYIQCATNPETKESVNDNLYEDADEIDSADYDNDNNNITE